MSGGVSIQAAGSGPRPADGHRTGGHLVAESLSALGAETVFGLPGVHALPMWEGIRTAGMRFVGLRTELSAGFAADGFARVSGAPTPVLLSTGPGALIASAALMEAASSHVPVVAIASQIPNSMVGRGRGYLHELEDQLGIFRAIVKSAVRASTAEAIPELLADAWREAQTAPSGPVYVEIPFDVLSAATPVPPADELDGQPRSRAPTTESIVEAASLLSSSRRPVIWAGGGVLRSGASPELLEIASALDAPVATTYMGKGAFPERHPLAFGSACDEPAFKQLITNSDVVLCVATSLGSVTTAEYSLRFNGRLVHVDAAAARIGASYPAHALIGDAAAVLRELRLYVESNDQRQSGAERAAEARSKIDETLAVQSHRGERELLRSIRSALPDDAVTAWDMTILGYWAAADFPDPQPRRFLHPLGSGTLGYAWPAAVGSSIALPDTPSLAVVGDGGSAYGLQELASARQAGARAKLLIVDDGGYGILAKYQRRDYGDGATFGVELIQPDFEALGEAYSIPARSTDPGSIAADLQWLMEQPGPALLVLRAVLEAPTAT